MPTPPEPFPIPAELAGQTLAAILRLRLPGQSWSQVRKLVETRRVLVDEALCQDPARRLKEGDVLEITAKPFPVHRGETVETLVIRYLDDDVVVVEKASGINTVRHPAEREWSDGRRELSPTLEDLTQRAIAEQLGRPKHTLPRLRTVQRLDKDTSGLVVFARSIPAERALGAQFREHSVIRRYLAIVPGFVPPQTFTSHLVRDRGDGRRGSGSESQGKLAITHVSVFERLPTHTMLLCQLETGKTHQIRIHLAEAGHPICGEKVYGTQPLVETGDPPRLALHATELGFVHPVSGANVHWEMVLPLDLQGFLVRLRRLEKR
ncbi:MAG: RluA family pseudouridine synthase [Planctomycetes bacterium]|nr:RluA family pseudouridine synthase [Planctomycetota bacterium]